MASSSRKKELVYLIDHYEEDIKGTKLPSNRQALGYFLYLHRKMKVTIREAATKTIENIEDFWSKARIPIRHKQDCIAKVENLFSQWQALKKNASRKTEKQQKNEDVFKDCFENLFDIAHANAMEMIHIQEDRDFLLAQREKGRRGAMCSVDMKLAAKEKKQVEQQTKKQLRREKAATEAKRLKETVVLGDDSSISTNEEDESDKSVPRPSHQSPGHSKRGRKELITPNLSAALDRNKVSDRVAVMVVGETAQALGHDISSLALNRSTLKRQRQKHRMVSATNIQSNFIPESDIPLIVHWDGKLLEDVSGKDKVDRVAILVSSLDGSSKLIAVPKIHASTGQAQANVVYNSLKEWKIDEKIAGMCFDTTSANTGRHNGACVLLEQLLARNLLHLACRHHLFELLAAAAFNASMGAAGNAPEILLFKRFKNSWKTIDTERFQDSTTDQLVVTAIADVREQLVDFINNALLQIQPRDDYRELLELTLIFLGSVPGRGRCFLAPGAMHKARWMCRIIYTFKIWLFRSQFRLTAHEEKNLRDLCIFFAKLYVKAWTEAPLAARAPYNDLQLLQSLVAYNAINPAISKATSQKLANHLWYLSEELVGLALFDENVTPDIKDLLVKSMTEVDGDDDPPKRAAVHLDDSLINKSVADFATKQTRALFTKLKLPDVFLEIPSSQWAENYEYKKAQNFVKHLAVTNDHAERGVALIQDFSGRVTKNEEQLQYLLQVVEDHRRRYPNALKRTLLQNRKPNENC